MKNRHLPEKHIDVLKPEYVPYRRIEKTMEFLAGHQPPPARVLDLGVRNMLSDRMRAAGYKVENTAGEDLDLEFGHLAEKPADLVTAFEILEHMVAPFNLLRSFKKGQKLIATVPLKVWFSKAYWHPVDERDRHFHEFEPRQFDMLLEKAGWKIIGAEQWKMPAGKINGIRPVLRFFVPTYYAVFAEKTT